MRWRACVRFLCGGFCLLPPSLRVCQTTTTTTAGVSNHRRRRHAREEKTAGTIGKVVVVVFNSSRGLSSNKKNSKSQNIPLFSLDVKYVGWRKSTHTRTHTKKKKTHRQTLNPNKKSPFGFCRLSSPSSSRFVFSSSRALFFGPTSAREREKEKEKRGFIRRRRKRRRICSARRRRRRKESPRYICAAR